MVYDEKSIRKGYAELSALLIAKKLTITTMESATSGQIASLITDTEGASAVLKGAFVTYCNEAKILQGVPGSIINKYTVYSKETAEAMARACAGAYDADIGIGVTGTFGNTDPENPEASEPGKIYYALYVKGRVYSYEAKLPPMPDRLGYKLAAAELIRVSLLQLIED